MDDLNLSELSDDQLLALFRATLREAGSRHPAIRAAVEAAGIDEQERQRIAAGASEREAAKLRALERERVARDAAERVRAEHAAREAAVNRLRVDEHVAQKLRDAERQEQIRRGWLEQFGAVLGLPPAKLTLLLLDTRYGRRVLVNEGGDSRYASEHLLDYHVSAATIKSSKSLVTKKPEALKLCVRFAATHEGATISILGAELTWPTVHAAAA